MIAARVQGLLFLSGSRAGQKHGWDTRGLIMTIKFAAAAAAALLACTAQAPAAHAEKTLDISNYELTFEDNFDSLDVSPWGPDTQWIAHTPWNGDFGIARFANPEDGFPFTTDDGVLRIEARKDNLGRWRTGLLASVNPEFEGFKQQYGYFEISTKLPEGKGFWPAFWLIARNERYSLEIDVIEHYGSKPDRYSITVHERYPFAAEKNQMTHHYVDIEPGELYEDFHTFGVDVTKETLDFYFDRERVWSVDTPENHTKPLAVLLNLALGGASQPDASTPSPSYMHVDYVRVWKRREES